MRIIVKAKTRAKGEMVERVGQPAMDFNSLRGETTLSETGKKTEMITYKVSVKEAPVQGKANDAIVRALATYFKVAPSCVTLISGQTSKQKVFEILE
ncbi:MAG: DUF167 domain-containing protein [Patescibacteria group bacterium]